MAWINLSLLPSHFPPSTTKNSRYYILKINNKTEKHRGEGRLSRDLETWRVTGGEFHGFSFYLIYRLISKGAGNQEPPIGTGKQTKTEHLPVTYTFFTKYLGRWTVSNTDLFTELTGLFNVPGVNSASYLYPWQRKFVCQRTIKSLLLGTSLVVQRLGICLSMQGTWV